MPPPVLPLPPPPPRRVHPLVEVLGAYSWRLIGIGIVLWVLLGAFDRLLLVVLPVVVATLATVVLGPPAQWLRRRGCPAALAAWAVCLAFFGGLVLCSMLVVPPVASEFGDLRQVIGQAYDDAQTWLVEDSPFDVDRGRLEELEAQARDAIGRSFGASRGALVRGAILLVEVLAGTVLAVVLTFFFVKDGHRFQSFALDRLPARHRDTARSMARRGWETLGGYLRGSAILGVLEAVVIGTALWATGGRLVVPVMVLTFVAAFVPFVGAVVAGLVTVAVALVTSGTSSALVVAAVALAVQQLDNDILAPVIFGRALELHPVVILIAITAGGALAGLVGAFLAVPVTAVAINVAGEANREMSDDP